MNSDELLKYAQEQGERFWVDAGNHWLNDGLDLKADAHVIEIGGYLGNWTDYVQRKYECYVDVYEPVKEFYEHMVRRFSNRPKIKVFNNGIEDFNGETHIAVMDEGSTLYTPGVSAGPIVQILNVTSILPKIGQVDLLAINSEGSEYNILERLLKTGEIWHVKELLVQFHASHDNADERRSRIRRVLPQTHDEVMCYPFCWEKWRRR